MNVGLVEIVFEVNPWPVKCGKVFSPPVIPTPILIHSLKLKCIFITDAMFLAKQFPKITANKQIWQQQQNTFLSYSNIIQKFRFFSVSMGLFPDLFQIF